jgi:hypothetical protein
VPVVGRVPVRVEVVPEKFATFAPCTHISIRTTGPVWPRPAADTSSHASHGDGSNLHICTPGVSGGAQGGSGETACTFTIRGVDFAENPVSSTSIIVSSCKPCGSFTTSSNGLPRCLHNLFAIYPQLHVVHAPPSAGSGGDHLKWA